jgi:hypothetical protein
VQIQQGNGRGLALHLAQRRKTQAKARIKSGPTIPFNGSAP